MPKFGQVLGTELKIYRLGEDLFISGGEVGKKFQLPNF